MADLCNGGFAFCSSDNGGSEVAASAFDNNFTSTKWLTTYTSPPCDAWVKIQLSSATTVISYSLTSGNDLPQRDPQEWLLQGSNDNVTWVLLDKQVNQTFPSRSQTINYNFSNGIPYLYYRLFITRIKFSVALPVETALSEIRLWTGASGTGTNVALTGTPTAFHANGPDPVTNIIDNNDTTKWVGNTDNGSPTRTWWLGYQLTSAAAINWYTVTSGNDAPERDPQDWKLQGSINGSDYFDADTRTAEFFSGRSVTKTYTFTNATSALFWRMKVTKRQDNGTSSLLQINEIEMDATGGGATALAAKLITRSQAVKRAAYW